MFWRLGGCGGGSWLASPRVCGATELSQSRGVRGGARSCSWLNYDTVAAATAATTLLAQYLTFIHTILTNITT